MNGLEWITEESKWLEKREYIDEWINIIVSDKIPLVKIPKDQNVDCFSYMIKHLQHHQIQKSFL